MISGTSASAKNSVLNGVSVRSLTQANNAAEKEGERRAAERELQRVDEQAGRVGAGIRAAIIVERKARRGHCGLRRQHALPNQEDERHQHEPCDQHNRRHAGEPAPVGAPLDRSRSHARRLCRCGHARAA